MVPFKECAFCHKTYMTTIKGKALLENKSFTPLNFTKLRQ